MLFLGLIFEDAKASSKSLATLNLKFKNVFITKLFSKGNFLKIRFLMKDKCFYWFLMNNFKINLINIIIYIFTDYKLNICKKKLDVL